MEYRPLGGTGLRVSILGYGASPLGGVFEPIDEQDGISAVHTALDLGVNVIDVSPYYGNTAAETVLGKALRGVVTGYPLAPLLRVAGVVPVDTVLSYCRYTLLDRALLAAVPALTAAGAGVMNASPLGMGLLSRRGVPDWHPAPAAVRAAAAGAAELCARRGVDIAQLALRFAVEPAAFATTFVGTASAGDMARNVRWALEPLDPDLLRDVEPALAPVLGHAWASGRPENHDPLPS